MISGVLWLVLVPAVVFCTILLSIEVAFRWTSSRRIPIPESPSASAVAGVAFSLLALILAFAYSDAASRLETHRTLAVQEANAIRGVWHRIDILDETHQGPARDLLRGYTDERIRAQEALPDIEGFERHRVRAGELHQQLWSGMVEVTKADRHLDDVLLLPPVLVLADVAAMRTLAVRTHISSLAFAVMFLMVFVSALLVGVTTTIGEKRNWPYRLVFAAGVSAATYVVIDMEYPRTGIDQAAAADAILVELRQSM